MSVRLCGMQSKLFEPSSLCDLSLATFFAKCKPTDICDERVGGDSDCRRREKHQFVVDDRLSASLTY